MKNNLFHYATSELSQDAFICWLMSYAMKDSKTDIGLQECAKEFLRLFIGDDASSDVWLSREPERQKDNIDILLTVNDTYLIVIEDKTFSSEHDSQLERYKEQVLKEGGDYQFRGVYYKTGFQGDYSVIEKAGYCIFDRERILSVLEKHIQNTTSEIFHSYYEVLKDIETQSKQYMNLPAAEWNWLQIKGFYSSLMTDSAVCEGAYKDFGYVSNPRGGFYGMWFFCDAVVKIDNTECELYLQMEYKDQKMDICYKAKSANDKIEQTVCDKLRWEKKDGKWFDFADEAGFKKPRRSRRGKTMTVGIYNGATDTADEIRDSLIEAYAHFKKIVQIIKRNNEK